MSGVHAARSFNAVKTGAPEVELHHSRSESCLLGAWPRTGDVIVVPGYRNVSLAEARPLTSQLTDPAAAVSVASIAYCSTAPHPI